MSTQTSRLALPYPQPTDPDDVPTYMGGLANALDVIIIKWQTGTLANRPAAGNAGFAYLATDVTGADGQLGQWFLDNGTVWLLINPPAALASAVSNSAVGDSGVVGTSTSAARQDHVHGRESFAGAGGLYGSATSPARSDHSHSVLLSSLAQSGASSGQVVSWNGSAWVPAMPTAGAPGTTVESYITANILGSPSGAIASVTLQAGTWLVIGRASIEITSPGSGTPNTDLYLGPNSNSVSAAYACATLYNSGAIPYDATVVKSIVLTAQTVVYLNFTSNLTCNIYATGQASGVPNASGITAVRTA